MFISAKHAYGASLEAADGRAGILYDILFDDQFWRVRHLVVSTDRWFHGHQVLVDPTIVENTDWPRHRLDVRSTKEVVANSPSIDSDLPVGPNTGPDAARLLVWEAYWAGIPEASTDASDNPHLRSTKVLSGLHVHCADGMLGHIDDFLIDDETWRIRYLVVETRNWWPGKRVLVETGWIESIHWEDGQVFLALSREEVLDRPAFEGQTPPEPSVVESA